ATGAVLAIVLGALSSPRRSIADLRLLAFAIGLTGVGLALGAAMVVPDEAWEQAVSIVGIMVTAAVFMPWSWRWQVAVVAVVVPAATIVYVALVPRTALDAPTATRLLVVIGAFAALSVVGSTLADRARRKVAASEARYRGLFAG